MAFCHNFESDKISRVTLFVSGKTVGGRQKMRKGKKEVCRPLISRYVYAPSLKCSCVLPDVSIYCQRKTFNRAYVFIFYVWYVTACDT